MWIHSLLYTYIFPFSVSREVLETICLHNNEHTYLPDLVSDSIFQKIYLLGEMGNFWTGAKNIQNELGHLVVQEREEAIKKKKKTHDVRETKDTIERAPNSQSRNIYLTK